jgi:hypothetical protein
VFIFLGLPKRTPRLRASAPPAPVRSPDEVTFELGDAGEDGHDHLASVSCGISPGFGEFYSYSGSSGRPSVRPSMDTRTRDR